MADIFLSYAEEDREVARRIVGVLESTGWSVWWDRRIPAGKTWRAVIEAAIREMRCMIVLWSSSSVTSDWVKEEAEEGRAAGKLMPILIERVKPPFGLRGIQAADLADWDGSGEAEAVRQLINDLTVMMGSVGQSKTHSTPSAPDAEFVLAPEEETSTLRRRLLLAASRDDIQHLLYETEALVARRPWDADARGLLDDIRRTLAPPRPQAAPTPAATRGPSARNRLFRPAWAAALMLVLAVPLVVILQQQRPSSDPLTSSDPVTSSPITAAPATIPVQPATVPQEPAQAKTAPVESPVSKPAIEAKRDAHVPSAAKPPSKGKVRNSRCEAILERAQLGQPLTEDDKAFLKKEC